MTITTNQIHNKLPGSSVRRASFVAAFFVALLFVTSSAQAAIIVPAGLNPGDTYHIAFVTSSTRDATSADIADYNAFVQAAADAAGIGSMAGGNTADVEWFAIASTEEDDARDNALVGETAGVFLVDGTTMVAYGFDDFWSGSLYAPISLTELGTSPIFSGVWTGSNFSGSAADPLGGTSGTPGSTWGRNDETSEIWIDIGFEALPIEQTNQLYALSEALTVPGSPANGTPEPSTFGLGIVAAAGLLALQWRRRRR